MANDSGLDDDSSDDGVSRLEDEVWQHPQLAGEDDHVLELLPFLTLEILLVSREAVEQVVDDVSLETRVNQLWSVHIL